MILSVYYRKLFVVGLFFGFAFQLFASRPDWVEKRPVDPQYYIGIGVVQKDNNRDYIQRGKNAALSDLSSEITVNISSELLDIAVEQSGMSKEQIRQEIRTTTKNELEGYELVDTYESRNEYWVYYRLSKALWEMKKQEKLDNAISLSKDLYTSGLAKSESGDVTEAIRFYLQALEPIQKYIAEPLETTVNGQNIYLKNEIYSRLQNTLSSIKLTPVATDIDGKYGMALESPVQVKAGFQGGENESISIGNLPLKFSFIRGDGELVRRVRTNSQGIGGSQVSKITSPENVQIIRANMSLNDLMPKDTSLTLVRNMVQSLAAPQTRIVLNISGLVARIESSESNFGEALEVAYIEPLVKNVLSDRGFSFSEESGNADFLIDIEAQSRKGSVVYGQHVAYVDLNISVLDMRSGEEIYKQSFTDVKGIHLDYERAGLKAFENAGEKLKEDFAPEFLSKIFPE